MILKRCLKNLLLIVLILFLSISYVFSAEEDLGQLQKLDSKYSNSGLNDGVKISENDLGKIENRITKNNEDEKKIPKTEYYIYINKENHIILTTEVPNKDKIKNKNSFVKFDSRKDAEVYGVLVKKGLVSEAEIREKTDLIDDYKNGIINNLDDEQLKIFNTYYKIDSLNVKKDKIENVVTEYNKFLEDIKNIKESKSININGNQVNCAEDSNKDICKNYLEKLENKKTIYENYFSKIKYENLIGFALNSDNNGVFLQELRNRECQGSFLESICKGIKIQDSKRYLQRDIARRANELKSEGKTVNEYNKKLDELVEEYCDDTDENCKTEVENYINDYKLEQTNYVGFSFLTALFNPNSGSLAVSEFFGNDPNYGRVPDFLKQSFSSRICLSKIEGFFDDKRQNNIQGRDGITAYRRCDDENSASETVNCVENYLDLRAQMTQIMPNGKFYLTFSYYIKSPQDYGYNYLIGGSFIDKNGVKQKFLVKNLTYLEPGKSDSGYETILLPKENLTIEEGRNFMLGIIALDENEVELSEKVPIVLINQANLPNPLYGEPSSNEENGNQNNENNTGTLDYDLSNEDENLNDDDLLEILFGN
jgi:hypothetical protein